LFWIVGEIPDCLTTKAAEIANFIEPNNPHEISLE
jgi:hypothetical protein